MEDLERLNLLSTLVPFVLIVFLITIGVILLNQQFRKNLYKQRLDKESLKAKHQENLIQSAVQVQEDERKRIARDLHDELGAALSIGKMQITQLQRTESITPENLDDVRSILDNTLSNIRRISHELTPLNLEKLGLELALKSLGSQVGNNGGPAVDICFDDHIPELPWLIELMLYRILSELINNTIKHAQASEVKIQIDSIDDLIHCTYSDNGQGLPEEARKNGLGFKSINHRIELVKGSWEYGNQNGFYAQFKIPLNPVNLD